MKVDKQDKLHEGGEEAATEAPKTRKEMIKE